MERLTKRNSNGTVGINELRPYNYDDFQKLAQKLADYEDAEEQGLLLKLPFRIGQEVYYIFESCIDGTLNVGKMIYSYSCLGFPRTYYATREEALKVLAEMKGV